MRHIVHIVFLMALAFALAACEQTNISDITADPGRYLEKDVNVAGRVTESYGFMQHGIYRIDDGTGTLWVLADQRGVPSQGALVGVKGRITPTVTFMGKNYATVMREGKRKSGD